MIGDTAMQTDSVLQLALAWCKEKGYMGKTGVTIVYDSSVQGWCAVFPSPRDWRPGSIAVNDSGHRWIAIGGNDYDGSETWMQITTNQRGENGTQIK